MYRKYDFTPRILQMLFTRGLTRTLDYYCIPAVFSVLSAERR